MKINVLCREYGPQRDPRQKYRISEQLDLLFGNAQSTKRLFTPYPLEFFNTGKLKIQEYPIITYILFDQSIVFRHSF